ncbi:MULTISPECIES: ABC transporter ATP-binding protein [Roseomonadaceae]|uniref:ABC transporter ATP-binding protein n=1 Tax=Falsiroseomonas oleicola TaxID=2801474 RepID=A0ABS6H742_9PROT|nr:ABC transporter ATP-binding protein [Roseomonas oleicola]MBU8543793.1 ABC transporter ATP-binding protein [Roseomonas oleicola]
MSAALTQALAAHRHPGALVLEGVTRRFGGLVATNEVTFTVPGGELLAIVGPNGAGKSTLVQLITGFVRPDAGRIRLGPHDLTRLPPERISALGVARSFQTSRVFPGLTVLESVLVGTQVQLIGGGRLPRAFNTLAETASVLFGLPAYAARRRLLEDRAEATLKLFGDRLWPRRDAPAFSLSYANRRRLEIARALVAEPDLLLLDEPTAGMNPTETGELADLIAQLHADRPALTIVMIEHKLQVVRQLASRVIVMNHGSVLVDATPEEALADPRVVTAYLGRAETSHAHG